MRPGSAWVVLTKKIPSNRGLSTAFCFCIRLHLNLSTGSDLFAQPDISSFTYLLAKLYVFCIIIRESDCQSIRLRLHLIWMFEFRFACNKNIIRGHYYPIINQSPHVHFFPIHAVEALSLVLLYSREKKEHRVTAKVFDYIFCCRFVCVRFFPFIA